LYVRRRHRPGIGHQADRSIDRTRGGLGLGLALVKGLIELHGGRVQACSAGIGQGSEFTVYLRRAPAAAQAPDRVVPGAAAGKALRVLVIEDNPDAADSLRLLLEVCGHRVEVAHAGPAGVEAARGLRPDVILCDIGLPGGMDGYAVARALRGDAEQADAVLIALSGYGQEEDVRKARQAGFDRHLTKPVDPAALTRLLDTLPLRPNG
jgi:CheY-like chemotaxis protein